MSAAFELFRNGDMTITTNNVTRFIMEVAHQEGISTAFFENSDLKITCPLDIFEPQAVVATISQKSFEEREDIAGGIHIEFRVSVKPLTVSFRHLYIQEIPRVSTDATGYFTQERFINSLDHGKNGAGNWVPLSPQNTYLDNAEIGLLPQPWLYGGSFTWPIPCAWRFWEGSETDMKEFTQYNQRFELDANGTVRIRKFGYCAERMTNAVYQITGGSL